ncbi:sugar transferase [Labilibacter sediminis]|nr:sugar transferase [Labilibacter sediminis]
MQSGNATIINKTGMQVNVFRQEITRQSLFHLSYKKEITDSLHPDVMEYLSQVVPLHSDKVLIVDSNKTPYYNKVLTNLIGIVDVNPINKLSDINHHLFKINENVCDAAIFVGCAKVMDLNEHTIHYRASHLWSAVKKLSSYVIKQPKNKNILSKAEVLGRLVYAGFSIIEFKEINGLLYYMVMKVKGSPSDKEGSNSSLIFPMQRIGKGGKKLKVFKFRTMHPYSQYLQDYVVRLNGYNSMGKPDKDFRLTPWGKFFRKYWLDELPQFVNLLRGELAVVGVRPLSNTRFAELPQDVREQRIQFKPGCIPPYVSLLMPDSKGNIEAERIYMNEKKKYGLRVDIKYFFMAIRNIITGRITSS